MPNAGREKPFTEHFKNENTQAVAGNINAAAALVRYQIKPEANELIEISYIQLTIEGINMTLAKYGTLAAVTVGITIEILDKNDNVLASFTPDTGIKSNGEMIEILGDSRPPVLDFPAGNDLLQPALDLNRTNSAFVLDGRNTERLVINLNDDFSTLLKHEFIARGHYVNIEL